MGRTIKVGIIGCGQIAQHHMGMYKNIEGVEMAAFCDVNLEAAEKSSKEYGPGVVTSDFREILSNPEIEAVDVCLHNNYHMPVTVEALKAGKHVYCEKPMAGSYVDAVKMLETAKECGKRLHIQLATLYSNEARAARQLIAEGALGEVFHARSSGFRRRGRPYVDGYGTPSFVQKSHASGGALYDMGVYHIAATLFLMGNPKVTRITGKTFQRLDMDSNRRSISNYDVEELGVGFVRFENDRSMEIIESWAANLDQFDGCWLMGSKGGVRLHPFGYFTNHGAIPMSATADLGVARYHWDNVTGDGHIYGESQAHWIAVLRGEIEQIPTAEIALNTMLVSEGIYLSQQLDREVTAQEVLDMSKSTAKAV